MRHLSCCQEYDTDKFKYTTNGGVKQQKKYNSEM